MRGRRALPALVGTVVLALGLLAVPGRPVAQGRREAFDRAFDRIYAVATHPRCMNCHGRDDQGTQTPTSRPLVGETTTTHPTKALIQSHPMNITVRHNPVEEDPTAPTATQRPLGLDCGTCHQVRNLHDRGTPPGAQGDKAHERWRMPTKQDMRIWPIHTSGAPEGDRKRTLCHQWAGFRERHPDPIFEQHIANDPLIKWAFEPNLPDGPIRTTTTREPAPGGRAGHDRLKQDVGTWIEWLKSGGSCDDLAR